VDPTSQRDSPSSGRTDDLEPPPQEEPNQSDPAAIDEPAVTRMRTIAYLLDESLPVPGTPFRVGIDPLIGVLPVSGDLVGAGLSLYLVAEAGRLGVSTPTLVRMLANVAVDLLVGSIPVLGTLFDASWKANKRNLQLALDDLSTGPTVRSTDSGWPRD
jgi:hypothetical protein